MASKVFHRPPRVWAGVVTADPIPLPTAPDLPDAESPSGWMTALPALSGLGSVAYLSAGPANPMTYVAGSILLLSSVVMVVGGLVHGRTSRRSRTDRGRRDFFAGLHRARERAVEAARAHRAAAELNGPSPDQLWSVANGPRLWERRTDDDDFAVVRVGTGPRPRDPPFRPVESGSAEDRDPVCAAALRRFVAAHADVPDLPLTVELRQFPVITVTGPDAFGLARALLAQAVTFHAPTDLRVAVCTPDPDRGPWAWVKWLPHAADTRCADRIGPARLVCRSIRQIQSVMAADLGHRGSGSIAQPAGSSPHWLLVVDGRSQELAPDWRHTEAVTVLVLGGSTAAPTSAPGLRLDVRGSRLSAMADGGPETTGTADTLSVTQVEALARQLAGFTLDPTDAVRGASTQSLPGLLGVVDPDTLDLRVLWGQRAERDRLRVPLGIGPGGRVVCLDLKEAALGGMGPHGLVVGATGSGKSELLRSLVVGLAATHSPQLLNLVLVDFKGGATFAEFAPLRHVAALITNLQGDSVMVDRMHEALSGELNRRQELLRAAGQASVRDYERARANGARLAPLPNLVVIVDEFTELLTQRPEFAELFVQIGRLGRSLGVHLLLASQRLDEGRLRGLESHISYRVALRTFSAADSRVVIGGPEAHQLPSAPGHGLLRDHTGTLSPFTAAHVSGPSPRAAPHLPSVEDNLDVLAFTAAGQPPTATARSQAARPVAGGAEPTVLSAFIKQLAHDGPRAHRVWLSPLGPPQTLDRLYGDLGLRTGRGFGADPARPALQIPLGEIDLPFYHRRDRLTIDLSGAGGHLAVVGGPRSGKSTLLRTVLSSLALRHTPLEVQLYVLDLSGGGLSGLRGLPHVGGVTGRQNVDAVRQTVAQVAQIVHHREARFAELGVDTMAGYLARQAAGAVTDDPYGHVFLAIDGFAVLRADFDDVEATLLALAGRALSYGVHLLLTSNRWLDLRPGLRDLLGTRLELRLVDPLDSEIDRRAAVGVPPDRAGRGLASDRNQFLAAVPRIDGHRSDPDLAGGLRDLVGTVAGAWSGSHAPVVALLPSCVHADELPLGVHQPGICVGIGIDRDAGIGAEQLKPLMLVPGVDPGMVVIGDAGSGKSSFLRGVARQVASSIPSSRAKLILLDYRRNLLAELAGDSLLGYAVNAHQAREVIAGLVEGLTRRMPGPDVSLNQLRERSWWTGPEIHLLIDDYDLVAESAGNPVHAVTEFLPHARDVGLHVYLTRSAAGTTRSLLDPLLSRARELGFPAVVLSAPTDEGSIFGVRPRPQIPGRGTLVHHRWGTVGVQLARFDPATPGCG